MLLLSPPALAQTAGTAQDLRNLRYCELIPVMRNGVTFTATVYNTLGLNDCPDDVWTAITEDRAKAFFGATHVVRNGPRHWVLDGILADGSTAAGETITIMGLAMTARATLELSLADLRPSPYKERTINRSTQWLYGAGKPMFILESPDGARYAMQSFALIVDKTLTYGDLPQLGARLQVPAGWRYTVVLPATDLAFTAQGRAIVIQDELQNTYQRLP
ncbi:MAG: hypothetical protein ACRC1H_04125 [Caldilineaceae bacterium]